VSTMELVTIMINPNRGGPTVAIAIWLNRGSPNAMKESRLRQSRLGSLLHSGISRHRDMFELEVSYTTKGVAIMTSLRGRDPMTVSLVVTTTTLEFSMLLKRSRSWHI